jgi:hypothetical protein
MLEHLPRTNPRNNKPNESTMKQIQTAFRFLTVIALLAVAVGCTTDLQNKENLAVAAGFKVITATTPDQISRLASLPPDKVTPVNYKGKRLYVLPDAKNNQAYVGRDAEFQAYQQLRLAQHLSNQNLEAAELNQQASMGWGWGGWGGWGVGWGGWGPGWY